MSSPVALIFGVGKNIGTSVAKSLAADGYKVATASRTDQPNSQFMHTSCDLADPSSVEKVFERVHATLGLALPDLQKVMAINLFSAYVAAQQAVSSFEAAPPDQPKAFIYTGNLLNTGPMPPLMSLGIGKSAAAHMIAYLSAVYQENGFR